ncbi:MAG: heparinase II/III family protein [Candidatus Hydrogenedentes bacterium]|nr:heparinase II/III family protein [Candidatus Hydrogenedentota bacterium]
MRTRLPKPILIAILLFLTLSTRAAEPDYAAKAAQLAAPRDRPSMYITAAPVPGLRSVADLRAGIQSGHAKKLWEALRESVDADLESPPVTPVRMDNGERVVLNRSYGIVSQAASRILNTALVGLVLEDRRYVDATLNQIMALFDEAQWPEWSDQAHLNKGMHADLRHGQLVLPVALAYDWLYHQLTPEERKAILDGLDEYAITPYKKGLEAGEHWSRRHSNWMTVVLGGFGVAGMALGLDHPDSAMLVANSLPMMETYLDALGPEGEFNESVQYAGSMFSVVGYFMAMRYASGGEDQPFDRHSLDKFYTWYMHFTFPPGRVAGFGDPAPDMPPVVTPVAAVAAATRNPVFQWFYEQYHTQMLESHRRRAMELLYYDATLEPKSPAGVLPLGRAYHYQGHLVSSRSSWDPDSCVSVVYGKSGREAHHGHADWGQVCIDGYGERLIVDLGSPPGYPKDSTERYYNYQQFGHNVFVFGQNELGGVHAREKNPGGATVYAEFDEDRGAAWTFDLGAVYGEGYTVTRTVVHLLPRTVVVLDTAKLPEVQPISLRWHLAKPVEPAPDGSFRCASGGVTLIGRMVQIAGNGSLSNGQHAYEPPYNKHRLGEEFAQRYEPYIEARSEADQCRVISMFSVTESNESHPVWQDTPARDIWSIQTPEGLVSVDLEEAGLTVALDDTALWQVAVGGE